MRRYELVEGTSSKFWEIDVSESSFTARWGRIGAKGQEKTQDFDSPAEAKAAAEKLIAEKLKKGYSLVDSSDAGQSVVPSALPVNAELEAKLAANRDDVAAWGVYADWLIEKGEGWGEVIARAIAGKPDEGKQQETAQALLGELLGDAASIEWKYGVMDHLSFMPEDQDALEEEGYDVILERALRHPAGRLVRKVTVGMNPSEDMAWNMDLPTKVLAAVGPLPLLEAVDMSRTNLHMDQISWRRVGDLRSLWKSAPRLKSLLLVGSQGSDDGVPIKLAPIDAPHLEELSIESGGLSVTAPKELGAANLPKLRRLVLQFGQDNYGCDSTVESLKGILDGKGLPSLKHLGLANSEWEDELIQAVLDSKVLPRLEVLDLSQGILCKTGPALLLANAAKLKHLKALDLSENFLQEEELAELKAAFPQADLAEQKELDGELDDDYSRYSSVGE